MLCYNTIFLQVSGYTEVCNITLFRLTQQNLLVNIYYVISEHMQYVSLQLHNKALVKLQTLDTLLQNNKFQLKT